MRTIGLMCLVLICTVTWLFAADYQIGGLVIGRYQDIEVKGDSDPLGTFSVSAARLNANVTVSEKVKIFLQADVAGEPEILDAYIDYSYSPLLNLRVGQFKLPFGFETQISKFDLLATARSLVLAHLWNNGFSRPYVRDIGFIVSGRRKILEYKVGVVNGSGYNFSTRPWLGEDGSFMRWGRDNNNTKDIVGRIGVGIPMFAGVGYSFYRGKWSIDYLGEQDPDRTAQAFDIFLDAGKMVIQFECLWATGRVGDLGEWKPVDYGGWFLLLGYRFKRFIEPIYKLDVCDPDKDANGDFLKDQYIGVNLKVHPSARFQFFYRESSVAKRWVGSAFLAQLAAKW